MGDYAWVGITFYEVPEEHLRTVFEFLDEMYGSHPSVRNPDGDELILGEQYTVDEMTLGWCSDEVSTLVQNAPGIVVEAHQSNRYEFNGQVLMHTPELGTFLNDSDGQGEIILSDDIVERVYNDLLASCDTDVYTPTAEQFKEALDRASGKPWLEQFRLLEDIAKNVAPAQRTLTRPEEPEIPDDGSDQSAIDKIADILAAPEWRSAADFLEWIANVIGTVRPHPGGYSTRAEYAKVFREATGRNAIRGDED